LDVCSGERADSVQNTQQILFILRIHLTQQHTKDMTTCCTNLQFYFFDTSRVCEGLMSWWQAILDKSQNCCVFFLLFCILWIVLWITEQSMSFVLT
jgi:hypothetical protein